MPHDRPRHRLRVAHVVQIEPGAVEVVALDRRAPPRALDDGVERGRGLVLRGLELREDPGCGRAPGARRPRARGGAPRLARSDADGPLLAGAGGLEGPRPPVHEQRPDDGLAVIDHRVAHRLGLPRFEELDPLALLDAQHLPLHLRVLPRVARHAQDERGLRAAPPPVHPHPARAAARGGGVRRLPHHEHVGRRAPGIFELDVDHPFGAPARAEEEPPAPRLAPGRARDARGHDARGARARLPERRARRRAERPHRAVARRPRAPVGGAVALRDRGDPRARHPRERRGPLLRPEPGADEHLDDASDPVPLRPSRLHAGARAAAYTLASSRAR